MSERTHKVNLIDLLYSSYTEQNALGVKHVAESVMQGSFDSVATLLAILDLDRMTESAAIGLAMVLFHKHSKLLGYWPYVQKVAAKNYTLPWLIYEGLCKSVAHRLQSSESAIERVLKVKADWQQQYDMPCVEPERAPEIERLCQCIKDLNAALALKD